MKAPVRKEATIEELADYHIKWNRPNPRWLEMKAVEAGVDLDRANGIDDGEGPRGG